MPPKKSKKPKVPKNPKAPSNKGKGKNKKGKKIKEIVEIDWAADEHFNPFVAIVYIEYDSKCFVYLQKVNEFKAELVEKYEKQKFEFVQNAPSRMTGADNSPRYGSFEIEFAQNARLQTELLWSGIDRGPPRIEKFPRYFDQLWPVITKILRRSLEIIEEAVESVPNEPLTEEPV